MRKKLLVIVLAYAMLLVPASTAPVVEDPATAMIPPVDAEMQYELEVNLRHMGLAAALEQKRLAVSLVDITDLQNPQYAGVNDRNMMYAASLPKIAIVLAGFERIKAGLMDYTPAVKEMFTNLIRFSSNTDASRAIQRIGFGFIANVLTSGAYRLYDPFLNGGLWIGKAYGGPNDYWRRDPMHNISHGATSLQVARFFLMLEQGRLAGPAYSAEIKEILSKPGINHKFVKGLSSIGVRDVYRKSGTWKDAHCDAALVEHDGRRYIAVALMKDDKGGEVLPQLIVKLDQIVMRRAQAGAVAAD
ncbi:MAG: serine hydrolase [Acidimicrobiia bacterium]|nr:serine hydrolase [Acidimicrobiia bacterium]